MYFLHNVYIASFIPVIINLVSSSSSNLTFIYYDISKRKIILIEEKIYKSIEVNSVFNITAI